MGICLNKPMIDLQIERKLTRELRQDERLDKYRNKLLILGPKHSGKSTIFNQLKYIHGNGFSHNERIAAKQSISSYIIESMQNIIECVQEYEKYKQYPITQFTLNDTAKLSAEFIQSLCIKQNQMNDLIAYHIEILWQQNAIKHIAEDADKYYIDTSCKYFLNNVSKYKSADYVPSDEDIIHLRIKCDGLNETEIDMGPDSFICYDLNYKPDACSVHKIINCFENVTAIIFVASLSCFDEAVFEDDKCYQKKIEWKQSLSSMERVVGDDILSVVLSFVGYPQNAMHQALDEFEELCHNQWFKNIPILLMMSKSDLFASKVHKIATGCDRNDFNAFNVCFPEYRGTYDYDSMSNYVVMEFEKHNRERNRRKLYRHLINGTDTQMVRKIFHDVQSIVIDSSLHKAGLQ